MTAVEWLLQSNEPAVRAMARRDLLDEHAAEDRERILDGSWVRSLLSGQQGDGSFGGHPYRKWTGAHWRLVSLVELGIPPREPRALAGANTVLDWLSGTEHLSAIKVVDGLARAHASKEGNALAVCIRLGLVDDPRVRLLADALVEWQWPDGGWNCDPRPEARRSSFHESLAPMWGLHEFATVTGDTNAAVAARRTAELFLAHRLFRSMRTGEPIHPSWTKLHYPPYWHYDILQALLILSRTGLAADQRTAEALAVLKSRRMKDGRWRPGGAWWGPPGSTSNTEVIDWGRGGPNEMITLNALRVLRAAGELSEGV